MPHATPSLSRKNRSHDFYKSIVMKIDKFIYYNNSKLILSMCQLSITFIFLIIIGCNLRYLTIQTKYYRNYWLISTPSIRRKYQFDYWGQLYWLLSILIFFKWVFWQKWNVCVIEGEIHQWNTYAAHGGKCGSLHQPGFSCVSLPIRKNIT